jgi:TonB family protein
MYRLFILILCASLPLNAYGDCANDSAQIKLALPPEALSIRNVLFSQLCGNGELFDITDPTLAGRLAGPRDIVPPAMWDPRGMPGKLLVAFAVELNGSVHHVTVIESSGNREIDARAVESWRTARYRTPAKLDGRPVRALMYFRFKAIVNGR